MTLGEGPGVDKWPWERGPVGEKYFRQSNFIANLGEPGEKFVL